MAAALRRSFEKSKWSNAETSPGAQTAAFASGQTLRVAAVSAFAPSSVWGAGEGGLCAKLAAAEARQGSLGPRPPARR
jgi:hypothetical protein